jgi:hypothetical protein
MIIGERLYIENLICKKSEIPLMELPQKCSKFKEDF